MKSKRLLFNAFIVSCIFITYRVTSNEKLKKGSTETIILNMEKYKTTNASLSIKTSEIYDKITNNSTRIEQTVKKGKENEKQKVQKLPEVIIIGASKGGKNKILEEICLYSLKLKGTAALKRYLEKHPQIDSAEREINFFNFNYHKGIEWYRYTF